MQCPQACLSAIALFPLVSKSGETRPRVSPSNLGVRSRKFCLSSSGSRKRPLENMEEQAWIWLNSTYFLGIQSTLSLNHERALYSVSYRISHLKWRETKQQPSLARLCYHVSCCLVSLPFLCNILRTTKALLNCKMIMLNTETPKASNNAGAKSISRPPVSRNSFREVIVMMMTRREISH